VKDINYTHTYIVSKVIK